MIEPLTDERYYARRLELGRQVEAARAEHAAAAHRAETGEGSAAELREKRAAIQDAMDLQSGLESAWTVEQANRTRDQAVLVQQQRVAAATAWHAWSASREGAADRFMAAWEVFAAEFQAQVEDRRKGWDIVRPYLTGDDSSDIATLSQAYFAGSEQQYVAGLLHKAGIDRVSDYNSISARRWVDTVSFEEVTRQNNTVLYTRTARLLPELRHVPMPSADGE